MTNNNPQKHVKAIGLLSGGLDSILAVKVVQQQGISVTGLSFVTPFFTATLARKAANDLKIPLVVEDITAEHFEMVKHPAHGYGKTMNPCIDCHGMMLNAAGRMMEQEKFDFIFTGEVLGERPMSQNRVSLDVVAKISGYAPYVLRPLSAKLLPETKPEQEGLVDRQQLLDIQGKSRKPQIALAKQFGVKEYPNPAGGCLLTDKSFSKRLKDLLTTGENPPLREIQLLTVGRHFRLSPKLKLIVGRDKRENEIIQRFFSDGDIILNTAPVPGPHCLLVGENSAALLEKSAHICAAYSDARDNTMCRVNLKGLPTQNYLQVLVDKKNREAFRI